MIPDQHHLRHESDYVRLVQINATIGVKALLFRQPAINGRSDRQSLRQLKTESGLLAMAYSVAGAL